MPNGGRDLPSYLIVAALALVTVLSTACVARRPGATQDEAELIELQQVLAKAWVAGDRAAIEQIISPEWTSTGPDGQRTDRTTVLAQVFQTGVHRIHRLEIDQVEARVFGDAAVVTGRTHGTGAFQGTTYDVFIRFTDTFVRRDGRWQAIASHSSLLPPRP